MFTMKKWELRLVSHCRNEDACEVSSSNPLESELCALVFSRDDDRMLTETQFDELVHRLKQEYFSHTREFMHRQ